MQTQQSNIEYILPSSTSTARGKGHWIGNTHTVNPLVLWRRGVRQRRRKHYIQHWGRSYPEGVDAETYHTNIWNHLDWRTSSEIQWWKFKGAPFHQRFQEFLRIFKNSWKCCRSKELLFPGGVGRTLFLPWLISVGTHQCLSKILGKWSKFLEWETGCSFHFVQSKGWTHLGTLFGYSHTAIHHIYCMNKRNLVLYNLILSPLKLDEKSLRNSSFRGKNNEIKGVQE